VFTIEPVINVTDFESGSLCLNTTTMRIIVEGIGLDLGSREDLNDFLKSEGIKCLLQNGIRQGYDRLVDGGTYTLGPPIQQQQQQQLLHPSSPQPPQDLRDVIHANATAIYTGWSCLGALPLTDADLKNTVLEVLPVALPSVKVWPPGSADQPAEDVIREETARPNLPPDLESIRSAILSLEYQGDTEDATHSAIDLLVLRPMKLFCMRNGCAITTNRNGVDASGATLRNLRPDVLLWLPSGVLAFKGEDKAFGVNIQEARDDLRNKMSLFTDAYFGTIPYQIAYACSGQMLEFRAFFRVSNSSKPREVKLTDAVNLGTMAGRSLCVRYAVNIARILEVMHRNHPLGGVIQLGKTIETLSSKVLIVGDFVRKSTRFFTNADVIKDLYKKLMSDVVPHLIRPKDEPKILRTTLIVNLFPVGYCKARPSSVDECKEAGRQRLTL